ncbi:MAG: nitroreductase family protein [Chloroflexi bacterium]|jgi:nitroreductase|nr:nitroreductase family protein [Chloroflexota bacterium]MBT4514221.1 nitroreductase family protein [Chloroflexota bacterium]MBT6680437.1 nitroreductase family protein [Chloroflexota bacterium]
MSTADRLDITLGDALFTLRAIRRIKPDPIPDADLQTILDAARQAPNGANRQPWHFVVLKDAGIRQKFGELYKVAWWAKRNDEGFFKPEDIPDHYKLAMALADKIGNVPAIVLVCTTAPGGRESVIPATQNLMLAARALGIGGTLTSLHADVEDDVQKLVGIPDGASVVYCIPLGYPEGRFGPVTRKPLNEIVSVDKWGTTPDWV